MRWTMALAMLVGTCGCVEARPPDDTKAPAADAGALDAPPEACLPAYDDPRLGGLPCVLEVVGWWRGDADCCGAGAVVWPPDLAERYGPDTACDIVDVLTAGTGEVCPPFWLAEEDERR
ncbi:MAG: hypothetical protein ACOCXM_09740 [Myxococcota bacterium]